ncbi:GNAT family N-acetyltransferase [Flexibacterium corallicola]|uniref:GNAT family N-acetyltransferase n=1 Tax=Flexibacterium corallicola TaxID=3037259 RepID=UPI00286F45BA|nr:GNAT family N-acetyltransferase [Pseudovibrio sp. M1P-2-3]
MLQEIDEYRLLAQVPNVEDYLRIRQNAGLSAFGEKAAELGLKGTLFAVSVFHRDQVIGMGRIVGDGGCFFQVVDIAVEPEHQGKGLGKQIMDALMEYLSEIPHRPAYVSLMADVPANTFYERYGFKETAPKSVGMAQFLR